MKAVQFSEYGGPDVLHVVDVAEPHAGPGQIRIAAKAAGVNPYDLKVRSGALAKTKTLSQPAGIGLDAAGVVDEIGDGVQDTAVGDEVFGSAIGGATAEFTVLKEWAAKPAAMSFEEAAGLPVATETARRALKQLGVGAGNTLLINGGAGGVGLSAIQFAVVLGARVVATASEANHEYLRSLGAEPTTYGDGLVERVRAIAPDGVDLAFDAAGHGALPALIEITGSADNVLTTADYAGATQYGVRLSSGGEFAAPEARREAAELFEQGKFRMPVAATFPMSEAAAAHEASASGHVLGKYVITVP